MRTTALGALTAVALAAPVLPAAASQDIQGELSHVQVDSSGHLSAALTASALPTGAGLDPAMARVFVDGHRVPASASVSKTQQMPKAVSSTLVIVDASGSMRGAGLTAARTAVRQFLAAAPANVLVGLATFSDLPHLLIAPTSDRARVLAELPGLRAKGKTALYDAVASGADSFNSDSGTHPRLVVVSDGADSASELTMSQVVRRLLAQHVSAEVVALHTRASDNQTLRQLADASGGRLVLAGNGAALATALQSSARAYATALTVRATVPPDLWGNDRHVTVVVDSTAGRVSARHTMTIGEIASTGEASMPTRQSSSALLWAGLLSIGAALLLGSAALFGEDGRSRRRTRRLVAGYTLTPEAEVHSGSPVARAALEMADRVAHSRGLHERLTLRLGRAGVSFTPSEWLLLQAGIAVASVFAFTVLGVAPAVSVFIGLIGAPILGHVFLGVRANRRRAAFVAALPDTLQLIAGSLSAGYSLAQSLDGVVMEGSQPVAAEFGRALAESRLGVPIERTLENVADRMDSEDFRWVVLAIQIQHQVGGNLAEVLLTVAGTMRERVQLQRHVRALSAEGRLSAYILIGLPIFILLYMLATSREYISLLYTTKMGFAMVVFAAVMLSIGTTVMKKMVKVEV